MAKRTPDFLGNAPLSAFPLCPLVWQKVLRDLQLSPQQTRIVEMLLRRKKCKEIARSLGLAEPTLRTYLRRIFERIGVSDQTELVIHIMALSHQANSCPACPPSE
jgi:DNA-binding CsgD family transcriptional regulator